MFSRPVTWTISATCSLVYSSPQSHFLFVSRKNENAIVFFEFFYRLSLTLAQVASFWRFRILYDVTNIAPDLVLGVTW